MGYPTTDRDALILTMLGEARGAGAIGMQKVGFSIMNRVARQGWQGKTILEVCLKVDQYDCWMTSDPNCEYLCSDDVTHNPMYETACGIADSLIAGTLTDTTNGAVSYYSTPIENVPNWSIGHQPCDEFANLIFFNDIA